MPAGKVLSIHDPPSTTITLPVMKEERELARKTADSAISVLVPRRCRGTILEKGWSLSELEIAFPPAKGREREIEEGGRKGDRKE